MPRLLCLVFLLISVELSADFQSRTLNPQQSLEVSEQPQGVFNFKAIAAAGNKARTLPSYALKKIIADEKADSLTFEVLGDGSDYYASVFLAENKTVLDGFEAVFPLKSRQWQSVTIPLQHFSRNVKPWSNPRMDGSRLSLEAKNIRYLAFGRGFKFNKFPHPSYQFKIRNIHFSQVGRSLQPQPQGGLKKVINKIKRGEKLKVLLLGDSITYMGKNLSHTVYALQSLAEKYKFEFEVSNQAVGGHSVRGADIILPRSLRVMPDPDLTVIMFGANDCKALTTESGYSAEVFEAQTLKLIHRIQTLNRGKSELLLINGVPRVDRSTMKSSNQVEPLLPAYDSISRKYNIHLVNSAAAFNAASPEDKQSWYKDSVHLTPAGLKFLGSLIEKKVKGLLQEAGK